MGSLTTRELDGTSSARSVQGADCADAAEAMALIVALAVDPEAGQPRVPDPEPAPARGRLTAELGLSLGAVSGMAPSVMPAAGVFAGLGWLSDSLWSPSARLALIALAPHEVRHAQGDARFGGQLVELTLCPLRAPLGAWVLQPCLAGEAGRHQAEGSKTEDPRSVVKPWLAAGGVLRLGLALHPRWWLEAQVAGLITLRRDRFWLAEDAVHQVPEAVARAAAGVSFRW